MRRAALLLLPGLWVADPASAAPVDCWAAEIEHASAQFGVPERWIRRVMDAESGGRVTHNGRPIVSRAGAMGLMQLMPGTWREMRAVLGLGHDPFHPRDNILAGTLYLRLMHDRFGYPGLFAAYNAGPARYAEILAGRRRLPQETRDYVARVTGVKNASPGLSRAPATLFIPSGFVASGENRTAAPKRDPALSQTGIFVALTTTKRP